LGVYIYNYLTHRSISMKSTILAVMPVWVSITFSIIVTGKLVVACILILIGFAVSWHIITLRTLKKKTSDRRIETTE
jgi:uncharacterized protein